MKSRVLIPLIMILVIRVGWAGTLKKGNNYSESLTLEEYPIGKEGKISITRQIKIDEAILAKRLKWREKFNRTKRRNKKIESFNKKLSPLGYELTLTNVKEWQWHCDLYQNGKMLLHNITPLSAEINGSKTDFALVVENAPNEFPLQLLIRKEGIEPYTSPAWVLYPVFLGDKLLTIEWEDKEFIQSTIPWTYMVKSNDDVIYTGKVRHFSIPEPMHAFYVRNNHWILEVLNEVIIDGKSLNKKLSYDSIFRYVFFKDKPLYFFMKEGKIGISYDGKTLPYSYDKVPHYPCCDNVGISVNEHMLWFYGLRNSTWYYVEMGIYD